MLKHRYVFIVLGMLLYPMASSAQVSIGIGFPNISIGINLQAYPQLLRIPGYPVYYAPRLGANFFFYDTMYWVFQDDNWYTSSWYNGPWGLVGPEYVPLFVLRIPVRYYRQPPPYFLGWRSDAPPRWGDHWGHEWEQRRSGWDRWDHNAIPVPAPLPAYQRQYSGDRYPRQVDQQQSLQQRNYRYQPRDPVVRQHYQEQAVKKAPAESSSRQQDTQRVGPRQQAAPAPAPRVQTPQPGRPEVQRQERAMPSAQPPQPEASPREQQKPNRQGREDRQPGRDTAREPQRGQERERGRDND